MKTSIKSARLKELEDFISSKKLLFKLEMSIMIAIGVAIITFLVVLFFGVWKLRTKVLPSRAGMPRKPRFRKRDKMLFYGRRMLRKVKSFTKNTVGSLPQGRGKIKNKQLVLKLARKLLQMRRHSALPQLRHKEPPQSFLETDSSEIEESDHRLPPEVLYMLRSTRVFGHFEKPLFLELVKHMETKNISAGSYLFRIGDQDDSIYVVQSGKLKVTIKEQDSTECLVKYVTTGESLHSLLSILDVLTGHVRPYKTVSAKAAVDTVVLRLPALAFQSLFERFPESLVRVVQIIMIRLQRVTFTALHNYLGLSSELLKSQSDKPSLLSISSISNPNNWPTSPRKHRGSLDMEKSEASRNPKFFIDNSADKPRSDFDVACERAGVENIGSTEIVDDGQPTPKLKIPSDTGTKSHHSDTSQEITDDVILQLAKKDLVNIIKIQDQSLLDDKLKVRRMKGGHSIIRQGDQDASLIFVVTGSLNVVQQMIGDEKKETLLFVALPGEIVGSLAVLTGEPSFFTMRAKVDTIVVTISKVEFYSIMREQPSVVLNVAHTTAVRIAPFVRQIDFALDWMMIEAGKALFRQGDQSDSVYIILTGRLRSVRTHHNGKKSLVAEYGRGELVGIVEVLTDTARTTTIMAVRDTECAHLPGDLLNLIKRKYPQIVTRLIHLLGQRILGHIETRDEVHMNLDHVSGIDKKVSVGNLSTIAVLGSNKDVPLTSFTLELQHSLQAIGNTTRLTSDIVKQNLGTGAFESINEFRLFNWLGQQEDMNIITLYQCDYSMTKWTKHCIRQADCILIVGLAKNDPSVGEVEQQMENIAVRAQKELVLLHDEDAESPKGTIEWLNARGWCSSHHHIRCPKRVLKKQAEIRVVESYERVYQTKPDRLSDFSRLARFLTGTSVGLVLGGGGARGLSHIGIVKALLEAEVPIDMVGGTSMGSFVGAVWCEDRNITRFTQRCREWSMDMTSIWQKVLDLTYPITSMFTGQSFNVTLEKTFKDRQIEDLWIPYFCITTDITSSSMRIHTHGSLWRYVRASMSLSGYLPPLCDPVDAHYLLDGGYVNNLPADVMKQLGANSIFAVDVGSRDSTESYNYGDKISGFWLLANKWSPWSETVKVPDMAEIQSRLAYVSCVRQLDHVKNSDYCEYIRPPIDKYGTLQFGSFDEIADVGYQHGKALLNGWIKGGLVDELFRPKPGHRKAFKDQPQMKRVQTMAQPSLAKFTDLAELVSKIEEPSPSSNVSQSSFDTDDEINEAMFDDGNEEDDDDDEYEDDDDDDDDIDIEDVINADIIEEKEDDLSGDDNKGLSVGISKSDGSLRHRIGKSSDQSV
ncbi:patatin-like phospholipase domain-containing protein 7 [Mytilus trossulus]|uniref:patatin-like phospholipase domain-containing protein 7 n=1 Tax=Mytilus trossulus TaxID=6551 RepID=UPI0030044072